MMVQQDLVDQKAQETRVVLAFQVVLVAHGWYYCF